MKAPETIEDFYRNKFHSLPDELPQGTGHFNVFRTEDCFVDGKSTVQYSRREFYKISLIYNDNRFHYADKSVTMNGPCLMFFNPVVPYTIESLSEMRTGYFCIFTESFFTEKIRGSLSELPMFSPLGKPGYSLSPADALEVAAIFSKMREEIASDYTYKYDLLRNYILELVHFALKREPAEKLYRHPDANSRITAVFMELLERQFPIESVNQRFRMRSARDFANELSIHVNHLNRAVKTTTGKTTSTLIAQRLAGEATALLRHTHWNISEIGYSLGFEQPSHFNNFFKKHTAQTPSSFRNV